MSYNVVFPISIITNASMGASVTSSAVEVTNQDNVGFQLRWSGTPVGTFSFQVSSDYSVDIYGNVVSAGNWIAVPVSPPIAAAGSSDTAYVDLNQLSAMYVRCVYTRVSGTGTLNALVVAKGV